MKGTRDNAILTFMGQAEGERWGRRAGEKQRAGGPERTGNLRGEGGGHVSQ